MRAQKNSLQNPCPICDKETTLAVIEPHPSHPERASYIPVYGLRTGQNYVPSATLNDGVAAADIPSLTPKLLANQLARRDQQLSQSSQVVPPKSWCSPFRRDSAPTLSTRVPQAVPG